MDTCKQCGVEISPAEGYYNNNTCNACAFGLPDSAVAFGGSEPVFTEEEEAAWEEMDAERDAMESFNEVPSYFEHFQQEKLNREVLTQSEGYVPHCHLCDETNKALLSPCQGCKKLVCPRHSLHPAVVLAVCDECVEAINQAAVKIA